jgi:hypothetical protein
MYCPYDNAEHPAEIKFNTEHVIPYALGGSNQFTISTCEFCNSTFGRDIDAPFLRVFPVAHERFIRNIESASGNPPSLLFHGTAEINGKTVTVEYEIMSEKKKLLTRPVVEKTEKADVTHYQIQAAPADVEKMIQSIDSKAARQGKQIVDIAGNPTTVAEILAQAGVQQLVPTIKCEWNYGSWGVAAQREFIKIALGMAHFTLGETFTRSNDANRLRDFLTAPQEDLDKFPIRGSVWPTMIDNPLSELSRVLGNRNNHVVAILHMDAQLVVLISLFGVFNGTISISSDSTICSLIDPGDGIIIQVDPVTRSFQRNTFVDLLEAFSRAAEAGDVTREQSTNE